MFHLTMCRELGCGAVYTGKLGDPCPECTGAVDEALDYLVNSRPLWWRWTKTKYGRLNRQLLRRQGQKCYVIAEGFNGTLWLQFEDGYNVAAMRYAAVPTRPEGVQPDLFYDD